MASLGHIAVGLAAARACQQPLEPLGKSRTVTLLLFPLLALLPDADVIGMMLGVPYWSHLGHRGATHSFVFAAAIGYLAGLVAKRWNTPPLRTAVAVGLVVASHPLLDMLTNGGLGCALFWPFDRTRYFAPWQPIPVAPIGLAMLSWGGVYVTVFEFVFFSPLLLFALGRRREARTTTR
jgi:inner membrane protein